MQKRISLEQTQARGMPGIPRIMHNSSCPFVPRGHVHSSCDFPVIFAENNFLGARSLPLRRRGIGGSLAGSVCSSVNGSVRSFGMATGTSRCCSESIGSRFVSCASFRSGTTKRVEFSRTPEVSAVRVPTGSNSGTALLDTGNIFFKNRRFRSDTRRLPSTTT